jgi:hypothetical protein
MQQLFTSRNVDINEEIFTKSLAAKQCYSKKTLTQRSKKDNKANEIKKISKMLIVTDFHLLII